MYVKYDEQIFGINQRTRSILSFVGKKTVKKSRDHVPLIAVSTWCEKISQRLAYILHRGEIPFRSQCFSTSDRNIFYILSTNGISCC